MTHGDASKVKCPKCRKPILRPVAEPGPTLGQIVEREIDCPHCKTRLYMWARWTVTVDLERLDLVQ